MYADMNETYDSIFAFEPLRGDAGAPLYMRLAGALSTMIEGGALPAGGALPPERRIAEHYGVSRVTVRKALEQLAANGAIESRHGSGHYVSRRLVSPLSGLRGFSEELAARGMKPSSRWIERAMMFPDPEESLSLGLAPGQRAARLTRLRCADDEPIALEVTAMPAWALPNPGAVTESLYAALEPTGMRPHRALQRMSAQALDARRADLLGVAEGAPILFTARVGYLSDGRAVEFTRTWARGDRWDFVTELR